MFPMIFGTTGAWTQEWNYNDIAKECPLTPEESSCGSVVAPHSDVWYVLEFQWGMFSFGLFRDVWLVVIPQS